MRATATTTVPATPATVWTVLSDHEGMARWAPGLRVDLIREGTPDRNGVGAQRRIQPAPLLPAFVEEVTAFDPEKRLAYRAVSGIPFRNYSGEVELAPVGNGTEIRYTVSADNQLPAVATVMANGLLFALKRQVKKAQR
ncbi:SRPBCC family protein [Mycolicibacillus trivialis]|uniref:Polyketide cyclase n=1 Tax=Mycolicibacillus trivialis TaxID=1798 RepID=A0A1X2EMK7_9MYCO|nr:SRPBCC family protein [Mycolicibacillus trivialis]ORX06635.1 hypothetical protein AWC30_05890 [Mycolicibacillus trivialis]